MAQKLEAPSETEVAEFQQKLKDFEATLNDEEKQQLAAMIVLATDAQDEEETKRVSGKERQPTDQEMEAFAKKLNDFHNSLPGDQHRVLDALVGRAFARDDADVQGYEYIWSGWVLANRRTWNYWWNVCDYQGGDLYNFGTAWSGGRKWRHIGCWVDE
jgi:hypothetical protein